MNCFDQILFDTYFDIKAISSPSFICIIYHRVSGHTQEHNMVHVPGKDMTYYMKNIGIEKALIVQEVESGYRMWTQGSVSPGIWHLIEVRDNFELTLQIYVEKPIRSRIQREIKRNDQGKDSQVHPIYIFRYLKKEHKLIHVKDYKLHFFLPHVELLVFILATVLDEPVASSVYYRPDYNIETGKLVFRCF